MGLTFKAAPGSPLKENDFTWGPIANMAVGDFNGDGRDDVARIGPAQGIVVYLSQNNGSFSAGAKVGTSIGSTSITSRESFLAGDFNGDNKVDLLLTGKAAPPNSDPVRWEVFAGVGDGTFLSAPTTQGQIAATGSLGGPNSTTAADVNEDGKIDLVSGLNDHEFAVALGNGAGTFTPAGGSPFNIPTPNNASDDAMEEVTIGQFSGNGKPDVALLFRNADATGIYVAEGDGTGAFTAPASNPVYAAAPGKPITSIAGIDLNGDSYTDLTITQPNRVDAGLEDMWTMLGGAAGLHQNTEAGNQVDAGYDPVGQQVTDINGDGHQDVAVALSGGQAAAVILGNGSGGLSRARNSPYALPPAGNNQNYWAEKVSTGDFNGDGSTDLAGLMESVNDLNYGVDIMLSIPSPASAPDAVFFPATTPGYESLPIQVTLTNDQGAPDLQISGFEIDDHGHNEADLFPVDHSDCGSTLAGGESCQIEVIFAPQVAGLASTNLRIEFANADSLAVPLIAETANPSFTVNQESPVDFGWSIAGYPPSQRTLTFTVNSSGTNDVVMSGASLSGSDAANFQILDPTGCVTTLPPGQSCQVKVKFAPVGDQPGNYSDVSLTIDTANAGSRQFDLLASAVQATHRISPSSQDFGSVTLGSSNGTVTKSFQIQPAGPLDLLPVEGVSIGGADADSFSITSPPCDSIVASTQPCTVTVKFAPRGGAAGPREASLDFDVFTTSGSPTSVPLSGTAAATPATPKPKLSLKLSAPAKVRRGKNFGVKVKIKNLGGAAAKSLVIKASVPGKLAAAVRPIKVSSLAAGGSVTKTLKVKVKPKARKRAKFKVKVSVKGTNVTVRTASTRPVKIK